MSSKKLTKKSAVAKTSKKAENVLQSLEVRNMSSDLIRDVAYRSGDLVVTFRTGSRYLYPSVPSELVMEFMASESFGRFFNENIKNLSCVRL